MTTRRIFIKNTAFAAAGLGIAPTLSGMRQVAASDKINIGVIGCNGMALVTSPRFEN